MSTEELSNEFDILYNNITSNQAAPLDEYEKSVFLTKAQYEIQYAYANPKGNKYMEGLDDSKKRMIDFSNLLVTADLKKIKVDSQFDERSICYPAPPDMFIPINEKCVDNNGRYIVVPLTYSGYDLYMTKPYQYPPKRHIWRLFTQNTYTDVPGIVDPIEPFAVDGNLGSGTVPEPGEMETKKEKRVIIELIGRSADGTDLKKKDDFTYTIRYIRRANPIILTNLPKGLTIDGKSKKSECELDEEIHREILTRAVELASAAYKGDLNTQIAVGSSSATNLGVVPQSKERD